MPAEPWRSPDLPAQADFVVGRAVVPTEPDGPAGPQDSRASQRGSQDGDPRRLALEVERRRTSPPILYTLRGRWAFTHQGFARRLLEYEPEGEPLAGGHPESVRAAEFLRDRMADHLAGPGLGIYEALRESLITVFEIYEDGIFDSVISNGRIWLAVVHRFPLQAGLRQLPDGTRLAAVTRAEAGFFGAGWQVQTYERPSRAQAKLLLYSGGDLLLEDHIW